MELNVATAAKPVKIPGPDHPITIERNPARVIVSIAGRVVADTREALTLREAAYPAVALSQEWGSSDSDGELIMSHDSAFISPSSFSCRDHSARDLALSPLYAELPRRGGTARRAWARRLL